MFPKKYFQNTKKEKLPRPFETASLLAPYLCLLYELLHVYFYLFRELNNVPYNSSPDLVCKLNKCSLQVLPEGDQTKS